MKRGGKLSGWERERKEFFEERRWEISEVEGKREEGSFVLEELERRDIEEQRRRRWERISSTSYNRWYKRVKGVGIPGYLKKGWTENRWGRIAKYRLGEGVREGIYWGKEEDRLCRLCGREEETWEHVWEECGRWGARGTWEEHVEEVLGEEGEGEEWILKLERFREGAYDEGEGERRRVGGMSESV